MFESISRCYHILHFHGALSKSLILIYSICSVSSVFHLKLNLLLRDFCKEIPTIIYSDKIEVFVLLGCVNL